MGFCLAFAGLWGARARRRAKSRSAGTRILAASGSAALLLYRTPLLSRDTVISGTSLRADKPISRSFAASPRLEARMRPASTFLVALAVLLWLVALVNAEGSGTDIVTGPGPTASADRESIAAALEMLPKQPVRIAVMDVAENRPDVRDYLLTLDAFTVKGNGVIYIVQQSATLDGARRGSTFFRAMLAVVIWHEMAHLDGADERGARKAEAELWGRFVRDGVTDHVTALRVLQELRKRPDDLHLASR